MVGSAAVGGEAAGTDLTLVAAGAEMGGLGACEDEADAVLPFVAVEAEAVGLAADEAAGAVLSFVGC